MVKGLPFQIDVRRRERRIDMVLGGIWTVSTVRAFTASLDANITLMRAGIEGSARALVDVRDLSLLSVVLTPFFATFVTEQSCICDRVAVLLGQMLGRLQAQRLIGGDSRYRIFNDPLAAEAWLREETA